MDKEQVGSVSTAYSIYETTESGTTTSHADSKGWRLANHSIQLKRSAGTEVRSSLKALLLIAVISVAVAVMSLPALVHFFLHVPGPNSSNASVSDVCDNIDWQEIPAGQGQPACLAMSYASSVCYQQLADWQHCVTGQNESISINSSSNVNQLMSEAEAVISDLTNFGTAECQEFAIPFVCSYLFPLCDAGNLYLPTSQDCFNISTGVCASEWSLAMSSPFGYLLPNCSQLPGDLPNSTFNNSINITCAEGFYVYGSACIPNCREWNQDTDKITNLLNAILWIGTTFGLISGILVVIGSFIRHNVMLRFPYIFLVFMSISYCLLAVEIMLSLADRSLYCTSDNLYQAYANSSIFCTISGASFQYCLLNITWLWFFHICSMFIKVFLPHWANRHPRIQQAINLCFCMLALVLPIPAVVMAIVNYRYIMISFQPVFCFPSDVNFYYFSTIMLMNILLDVGVALYMLLFWKLHNLHSNIASSNLLHWERWRVYLARQKFMIHIGYYFVLTMFVLIVFEVTQQDYPAFNSTISTYFACEQNGLPNSCNPDTYKKYTHDWLNAIAYILISLLMIVHLFYVIDWKLVAQKCCQRQKDETRLLTTDDQTVPSSFSSHPMGDHGSSFTSTM